MEQGHFSRVSDDARIILHNLERYLRLEAVDKLTVVMTIVIVAAITFALSTSAIFFISMGVVKSITLLTENEMLSFYIVGAVLLLIILIFILLRGPLVERPLVRMLSKNLLETPSLTHRYVARKDKADQIHKLAEELSRELEEYEQEGGDE